jgi:DNA (cytosine-5)-methyltransferase 1
MPVLRCIELFAGVGGFRLGLERASQDYRTVWSSQWEPSTKTQHASQVYVKNFGPEGHSNEDISTVAADSIPDHDLLTAGFPCQDYSVARTLNQATGLRGKKGVMWWEIHRILEIKRPRWVFLENVDRLLKSPATQRGRDFAIMLASLSDLGYAVEWRVVNAADYGMPQRRRRVFILAYHSSAPGGIHGEATTVSQWLTTEGVLAEAFPASAGAELNKFKLIGSLEDLSEQAERFPFENTGAMKGRMVWTIKTRPRYEGPKATLGDVLLTNGDVTPELYLDPDSLDRWAYLKGGKNEQRTNKAGGFEYRYAEGPVAFPDPLDRPSRTIITGEGGSGPSRFKHVVRDHTGHLRRLASVELERLNMFPDGHTEGVSEARRAFLMGNALVVGAIERVAAALMRRLSEEG